MFPRNRKRGAGHSAQDPGRARHGGDRPANAKSGARHDGRRPACRILPATEADLPAISRLAAVIWRACYPGIITRGQIDYMLVRMYALDTMREEIRSRDIRYDRLLAGGEFVGFASYGPTEEADVFKLHKLYLHPKWQGRGLGSLLLQHCQREARRLGARRLVLNVNKRNAQAIAAYRRNGFRIADSALAEIGGGFVMDDFVMARELGPRQGPERRRRGP